MKKLSVILLVAGGLTWLQPAWGQETPKNGSGGETKPQPSRFDLDFRGGHPADLVHAIEKATSRPLNVIIPDELADTQIPGLKMKAVTVPELFDAVSLASRKQVAYITGTAFGGGGGFGGRPNYQYAYSTESYGFKTPVNAREDSIWYFYHEGPVKPPEPPEDEPKRHVTCRYFQLAPYLETYKIDDITTAVEAGWRMLGSQPGSANSPFGMTGGAAGVASSRRTSVHAPPEMSFHKDTKLLIAVGEPDDLRLIDSVLEQLSAKSPVKKPADKTPAPAKSGESENQ